MTTEPTANPTVRADPVGADPRARPDPADSVRADLRVRPETAPPPTTRPLPPGWRWARLGDICSIDKNTNGPTGGPIIGLEHIESDTGRIIDDATPVAYKITSAFDERHVLYGKLRPYLNKVALPGFPGRCTTEILPLLPAEACDREFLAWLLRRPETVEAAMGEKTGTRMPRADMKHLMRLPILLPPLPEQRRIAAVLRDQLDAVRRAREAARARLDAARALPAAFLRSVFESEGAKQWPVVGLGDVCEVQLGKMLSPKSKTGTAPRPYLRNANVLWDSFDLTDVYEMDFSGREAEKFELRTGDLLVCEGGEPGRSAVWNGQMSPCYYQKALHRLRAVRDISPRFVMYRLWMGALKEEFLGTHAKTTIAHLPAVRLRTLQIHAPSVADQQHTVARLDDHLDRGRRLAAVVEAELAAIDALPQSLLRQAFAGEL